MIELRGQRALVTGGGKRVGAAIALALGRAGMKVIVHYHASREGADAVCEVIRESGGEATALEADLYDPHSAVSLVDRAVGALGGLDLLVSSAANFDRVAFDEVDERAWTRAMQLNVRAPFLLIQRAAPTLRGSGGSVVCVTCTSATTPYRNYLPYVVSKGALQKMVRALALELAPKVRVNAVAPGTVLPPEDMTAAEVAHLAARIPLGRIGSAEDIADAVLYLARAPFVTGQEIIVDGGRTVAAVGSGLSDDLGDD